MEEYLIDLMLEEEDLDVEVFVDEGLSPLQYALNAAKSEGRAKEYSERARESAELSASYSNKAENIVNNFDAHVEEVKDTLKGEDGFSPIASVEATTDGATITITDKYSTSQATILNGEKGEKGDSGVYVGDTEPNPEEYPIWVDTRDDEEIEVVLKSEFESEIARLETEIEKATPSDYDQVKEDIALLKWKTLNLATEIVDSTEAYSKAIPNSVYEKALLNRLGGKTEVANQLVNIYLGGTISYGVSFKRLNAQKYHIEGTSTGFAYTNIETNIQTKMKIGHKYLVRMFGDGKAYVFDSYNNQFNINEKYIYNYESEKTIFLALKVANGVSLNGDYTICIADLTQRYGAGNEPTSVDDIRIKLLDKELEANPSYNEGSLVSASVESIVVEGANLWDAKSHNYEDKTISGITYKANDDGNYELSGVASARSVLYVLNNSKAPLKIEKGTYTFSANFQYLVGAFSSTLTGWKDINSSKMVFTFSDDTYITDVWFSVAQGTNVPLGTKLNFKLERGSVATPYTPYHKDTKPIASIIAKYFPQGMKSAGSVYDEIDIERGVAIQRVGSVDWGNLSYSANIVGTNSNRYLTNFSEAKTMTTNVLNAKGIRFVSSGISNDIPNIAEFLNNILYLRTDKTITNLIELKAFLGASLLYYELATPTETPLTAEEIAYLEALQVESNGTITFANAEYLQVPNEESYLKRVE